MPWNETSGNNFAALAGSLGSNASSLTNGIQQGASGLAGAILDQGQRNFDNNLKLWEYEDKRDKARQDALADADSSAAFVEAASITPDEYNQMKDQGISLYEELMAKHPMALFGGNSNTSLSDLLTGSTTSRNNRLSGIQSIVAGLDKQAKERSKSNLNKLMSDGYEHSADEIRSIGGYANLTDNEVQDKLREGNANFLRQLIANNPHSNFLRASTTNGMITPQDILKGLSDRLEKSGLYVNDMAIQEAINDPNISKYLDNLGNQNLANNLNTIQKDLFQVISDNPDMTPEDAIKKVISDKVGDFQLLTENQQKMVLGKAKEYIDQRAKMANDPNSLYSRIVNNQSGDITTKYNTKLAQVNTAYKAQLDTAAKSFIIAKGGTDLTPDQRDELTHLFRVVNSTGLGTANISENKLDKLVQVGSALTGIHFNLNDKTASDIFEMYKTAIEYGFKDPVKMQQAINCLQNFENFDAKELKDDREAALQYRADNRDVMATVARDISDAESIGRQQLQGVNAAHNAKVAAIQLGQQQELAKISNIAFAGAASGHNAKEILANIDKSKLEGLISSDNDVNSATGKADAVLRDVNAPMADITQSPDLGITADDLAYKPNEKFPIFSRLSNDYVGYNGSDTSTGFHRIADTAGGVAGALAAIALSKGKSGTGWKSLAKYLGGKATKSAVGAIGGMEAGSYISDNIPADMPFASGSREEQYVSNLITRAQQSGASKEKLAELATKAHMMYPNNQTFARWAREYNSSLK